MNSAALGAEDTSYRFQVQSLVESFVVAGEEVRDYLDHGRSVSDQRWQIMDTALKRYASARQAVDPRNKGICAGYSFFPMIFGNNSRQAPMSFERLVTELNVMLRAMLDKVIDLVIEHVDLLIGAPTSAAGSSQSMADHPSMAILKESFLELDVAKPLEERFSIKELIKVRQRDPLLNNGKLDEYLKKYVAQMGGKAIHDRILSRSAECKTLVEIKTLIESSREPVRETWRTIVKDGLIDFFSGQLQYLVNDLVYHNKKTQHISLQAMLTAYLQHIVNTDDMARKKERQHELSGLIVDLGIKTDSLFSLWSRLDGQDDPDKLGAAAARHLERRRQRELTLRYANVIFTLPQSNYRAMPVTRLRRAHREEDALYMPHLENHTFVETADLLSEDDSFVELRKMLRESYKLDVFASHGGANNLFIAVAQVVYPSREIKKTRPPAESDAIRELRGHEHLKLAADQLRAVTASEMSNYYRTDERSAKATKLLGEPIEKYIERIKEGKYRGDLFCLFFLASFFNRPFRVWLPARGSILVPDRSGTLASTAFQLMLMAQSPSEQPPAEHYTIQWFPVQLTATTKQVRFSGNNKIHEMPMTDEDCAARITSDPEPLARIKRKRDGDDRPR